MGALAALVSLGYYLGLIRDAYFETGEASSGERNRPHAAGERAVVFACALPAAVLGALPWLAGLLSGALSGL